MQSIRSDGRDVVPSKIICVGRNFAEHVKEMGGDIPPAHPIIFLKPNSALVASPKQVVIDAAFGLVHHEVELCVLLGSGGSHLSASEAERCVSGYAVGIDLTLRDMQAEAKRGGMPWALAKGFDRSAVLGNVVAAAQIHRLPDLEIRLSINGQLRQRAFLGKMLFQPPEIIASVSRFMTVEPGDLVMCGTPAGVGAVVDGDHIEASCGDLSFLRFELCRP